ncbi:uncharacterized protein [Diadema setosum]|uniref:uncharacterized protein n=1 Tax=Diadema setosum TaxID=31175 RepID=UPI003B3A1462
MIQKFNFGFGIYIYPVKFMMMAECYEGIPSVKLVDGHSLSEGLVVLEPDSYVCYDGFTNKAAELVCRELGFPAAEEHSAQSLPRTAKGNSYQQLSCPEGNAFQSVMDCLPTTTKCLLKKVVRLKCQGSSGSCDHPGDVPYGYWDSNVTNFGSRLTLTCDEGYVIYGNATLQCVQLPGWSTYFPVWSASIPPCLRVDHKGHETSVAYILGALLCIISTLSIVSIAFCKLQKRRHRPLEASDQSNGHTHDGQLQHPRETDNGVSLNPASPDSGTVSRPLTDHQVNGPGTLSAHQENPYHISQNIAEVDMTSCHRAEVEKTSFLPRQEYHSLQETSTALDECYQDRDYHDSDRTTDRMTSGAAKSCGRAHLFDERCYNSLNFGIRSDGVCTGRQDVNIPNAHPQRGRHVDKSDRNRPLVIGSSTTMSSEEIFYYQVERDNETDTRRAPLYAKVNKHRDIVQQNSRESAIIVSGRGGTDIHKLQTSQMTTRMTGGKQCRRETNRGVSLNPASVDSSTSNSRPLPDHSKLVTLSAHQENPDHVYQDIAEVDKMPCHHAGVEAPSLTYEYLSLQETPPEQDECYGEHEYATRIWK